MTVQDTNILLQNNLLLSLLDCVHTKDGLYALFHELQRHIPFDVARIHLADRTLRMTTIYLEYSIQSSLKNPYTAPMLKERASDDTLFSVFPATNKCLLCNDIRRQPIFCAQMKEVGLSQRSIIYTLLKTDPQLEQRYTLYLLASRENSFTEEHVSILEAALHLIRPLFLRYLRDAPEGPLFLSSEGPLPVTREQQLRCCSGLSQVMNLVDIVAPTDTTVLITGPTGSGKELVAETLHSQSPRYRAPFIRVNCGSIPETLLDSAFFGHEKGSFTGATSRQSGYFEEANHGTIYLDEIGELPLSAQVRLLRVLENREIMRVGSSRSIPVDVRVIAATNRSLPGMVAEGRFREDLYYRIAVFPITIPALRDRPEDIPILAEIFYRHIVAQLKIKHAPRISRRTMDVLRSKPWPGNVRQLKNAMERAILLSSARKEDFVRFEPETGEAAWKQISGQGEDREAMLRALEKSGWRIQGREGAAALLGLPPATLRKRMKKAGIPLPAERRKGKTSESSL
ncbi:MAG TPA: sigma-54 dependent transcriptional regulator [Candidatus Mailhella merdavium]|nr:sigma-54 dependent transcriptional regulator [Candidatus Mailhella merdavium]